MQVTKILKVGVQAIAGLTFGTETIPKVYKIFGPGNQFVTVANRTQLAWQSICQQARQIIDCG
jgi:histidinol dehydrogenase